MWSNDKNFPARGFLTPQPPAWKKTQSTTLLPMSERKRLSPANNSDCFHVIHKVPASDSPYGRAKHVQLIDKDPSKAISLFWAAINTGDRVDSALKDMAVVMKQLNRSDEAIEAIKSFRHLCPYDSQESLDNVLVELYKRSGRVEEEIEILQNKLRKIDEGTVFGGKRTKIARSQGKKIQITIEQEKSRILGNLAWSYLQQHNYGIAEQHYRKALFLEPDKNKQCNLAICLMHMNRISEAKSLLQDVKASSGNEQMDESYSKSYERALEMLIQQESQSMLEPVLAQQPDHRSLKEASVFLPRNEDNIPGFMDRRRFPYAHWQGKMLSDEQNGESYCRNHLEKNDFCGYDDRSSQCTPIGLKGNLQSSSPLTEKWRKANRKNSEALFTQPRRCSWGFNTANKKRGGRWGEDTVRNSIRKLSFEQTLKSTESVVSSSIQNLNEEPQQASSNGKSENPATGQEEEEVQEDLSGVLFTQPRNSLLWLNNRDQRRGKWAEESVGEKTGNPPNKKIWADMVEEEEKEEELVRGRKYVGLGKKITGFNREEELNDENLNSNIIYDQHPDSKDHIGNITQHLESLDMKGGYNGASEKSTVSSRRNRLQVFRDITSP